MFLLPFSLSLSLSFSFSLCFVVPGPSSLPFSPLTMPTSCPNAIKLLAARRANGEMSLTVVVIAGACRVSRFKSSLYLLHDRPVPGLNPIFVFVRRRFPGDRSRSTNPILTVPESLCHSVSRRLQWLSDGLLSLCSLVCFNRPRNSIIG